MMATTECHIDMLRVLIEGGADINIGDQVELKCIENVHLLHAIDDVKAPHVHVYMCTSVCLHLSMCILHQLSVTVLYAVYLYIYYMYAGSNENG